MKCKLCGEEKVLWDTIVSDKKVYDDLCYNCVDKIYMAVAGESCSVLGGLIHDYSKLDKENENKKELGLALYTALSKELEKQGLTDDIPSVIDQLVGKNCGEYADMYNEYKNQQKELAIYKKALELACESVVKHEKRVDEEMGIITFFGETFDYDVKEFVEHYFQQAKEKMDEQKTSKKE